MSEKLTEEEFLAEIDNLFRSAHDGLLPHEEEFECTHKWCGKFYVQLKEIIIQHFRWNNMKLSDYEQGKILIKQKPEEGYMKISDHPDIPFMKEVGQQKPRVSSKQTGKFLEDLIRLDFETRNTALNHAHFSFDNWLKEIGVEVE